MITGKVWGSTRLLLETPTFAIHELSILPCAHCSMHVHRYKWNGFYVISGLLRIEVLKSEYALTDVTELGPGDFTTVRPGEDHRFLSGSAPVLALEFYYTPQLSEDIIRRDHGGRSAV